MSSTAFFEEPEQQSVIKAKIVSEYFLAWAKVMLKSRGVDEIRYVDLFAGPGQYRSGALSTPLLILSKAIDEPDLYNAFQAIFNDKDSGKVRLLEQAIGRLQHIDRLRKPPLFYNVVVDQDLTTQIENRPKRPPTLTFIDPFGYKGLSIRLVEAVIKDWGSECIFFFNYNRINPALENDLVSELMAELFGIELANVLRQDLRRLREDQPEQREQIIVGALRQALKKDKRYVSLFRFTTASGQRTSHYLVFVTKHRLGFKIMQEIMARYSSEAVQGVPSFEFNPARERQPRLIQFATPIDDLALELLNTFQGKTLTRQEIYEAHRSDMFVPANYRVALLKLERKGQIQTNPTQRRPGTFGPNVQAIFPA